MLRKKVKVIVAMLLCMTLFQGSLAQAATLTETERQVVIQGYSTMQSTFTAVSDTLYVNAKIHQGTQGFTLKIEGVNTTYSSNAYFPYYITRPDATFKLETGQEYKITVTNDNTTTVYTTITFKY